RLGLDDPGHMHKLRILASSASLPLDEERGLQSLKYLKDLFAPFGTCVDAGDPGSTEAEFWRSCVVPGQANVPSWNARSLSSGDKTRVDAVRGLMLVRALPESKCEEFAAKLPEGVPSFRFHGFIRNVEGLFGSIRSVRGGIEIDDLTMERGVSHGTPAGDEPR